MEGSRDYSFDILKGILILLVVLGHAIHYQYGENCWYFPLFDFIYTFHMPLFIMVSGCFFISCTKRTPMEMLKNKSKRLLLPWFVWSLLVLLVSLIIKILFLKDSLSSMGIIKTIFIEFGTYWYLLCVFSLTLFYYPMFRLENGKNRVFVSGLLFIAWFCSLCFFQKIPSEFYLFKHSQITRQTIIFGIGILFSLYYDRMKSWVKVILCVGCLLGVFCDRILFGRWIIEYNLYQRIVDGFFCSLPMFFVLKKLSQLLNARNFKLRRFLIYCGQNSLGIYMVHMFFSHTLIKYPMLPQNSSLLGSFLLFFFYFIVSVLLIEIVKRATTKSYVFGI